MSNFLITILTKTMIPRAIAMALAGALLAWGVLSDKTVQREMYTPDGQKIIVEESQKNLVGEAIALVIVGVGSLFIERRKDNETKKTQRMIDHLTPDDHPEVVQDGLSGPETRAGIQSVANAPPKPATKDG